MEEVAVVRLRRRAGWELLRLDGKPEEEPGAPA
jgi:hypothetical protein